jgi:hypothetical protein
MSNKQDYKKLFLLLPEKEVSPLLKDKVMARIEHTRLIHTRIRGSAHIFISLASVVAFFVTANYILYQSYNSGFSEYASLFISDTAYAFSNFKMVALSLLESMPIVSITLAFVTLFIFANSLKRSITSLHKSTHIAHSKYLHA